MSSALSGRVYDIQGFSVHDGPGIRTTVFLKGCPLRCLWCHSPESQMFKKEVCHMPLRCIGIEKCGACISACPRNAIIPGAALFSEAKNETIRQTTLCRENCDDCLECAAVCYSNALFVSGEDYTPEELFQRISADALFYKNSEGGVTLSGGEPMSQAEFSTAILKLCAQHGIHTALDTTGFAPYELYEEILPHVNLFLYDLKHMDSAVHKRLTGVANELILSNAKKLAGAGARFQMRVPIIPGFNDERDNLLEVGRFCESISGSIDVLQLLPYHPFGVSKYGRLQREYPMPESVAPPGEEKMDDIKELMLRFVQNVVIH